MKDRKNGKNIKVIEILMRDRFRRKGAGLSEMVCTGEKEESDMEHRYKRSVKKGIGSQWIFCCLACIVFFLRSGLAAEAAEPVVVVLDPGHGGSNLGAEHEEYTEKEMTMIVAKAMKEELEKYEGITVYLTHETDMDMSLEERAAFAMEKNADFLYCLHFNMSEEHNKFGAEVWVSAFGDKYQKGYAFASVEMELLEQKGLYSRGIKTRLNDSGEDYYGILRHCTAMDVPAALIEHCHLDQENDREFYNSEEKMRQFGILDATAAAKYFGLRSEELGVDYSNYKNVEIPEPSVPVKPDTSEPDICVMEVENVDAQTGEVTVRVSAADYDSYILYYSYSYDGGETFSDLFRWEPRNADTLTFVMQVPSGTMPEAVVNVYNGYDRITESNHVSLPSMYYEEAVEAGSMSAESNVGILRGESAGEETGTGNTEGTRNIERTGNLEKTENPKGQQDEEGENRNDAGRIGEYTGNRKVPSTDKEEDSRVTIMYFLQVCFVCVAILFVLLLLARLIMGRRGWKSGPSKKKGGRKK